MLLSFFLYYVIVRWCWRLSLGARAMARFFYFALLLALLAFPMVLPSSVSAQSVVSFVTCNFSNRANSGLVNSVPVGNQLIDGNLAVDVPLCNYADNVGYYEGAGVIWSSPVTLSSFAFVSGSRSGTYAGKTIELLTGPILQVTSDGSVWTDVGSTWSPAYFLGLGTPGTTFLMSISPQAVLGVRVVGTMATNSRVAMIREISYAWSAIPTNTPTNTSTNTPTVTNTPTNTSTNMPTDTVTATQTATDTSTVTTTPTNTPTDTATATSFVLVTATSIPSPTVTATPLPDLVGITRQGVELQLFSSVSLLGLVVVGFFFFILRR